MVKYKVGLVDADILQYEVSFAAEVLWRSMLQKQGEEDDSLPPWDVVLMVLEGRVDKIMEAAQAEVPMLLFTGKGNFRHHLASIQPYKDRNDERPFHYKNVKAALQARYTWAEKPGLEADDLIGTLMTEHPDKYVCITRDKDLRQLPGQHYGWEVNNQPEFGPRYIDTLGFLELHSDQKNRKKIVGGGSKFFHAQLLMGDRVDSIPGIDKYGPVKAFNTLEKANTLAELEEAVVGVYKGFYGDFWLERLLEVGNLLHMVREVSEDYLWIKLWKPSFVQEDTWLNVKTGERKSELS